MSDYTYKEQYSLIKSIRLKDGETKRMDCVFCKGYNCLGISKVNGRLEWHCFRVSCNARGVYDYEQNPEQLKERLAKVMASEPTNIPVPDLLVSVVNRVPIIDFLNSVNAIQAYEAGLVDIQYSPSEDRVMFLTPDKHGAVGRSLEGKPKWKKYGNTSKGFPCGKGPIAVVVEDAPSACAVGVLPEYTGFALLGTSLTTVHRTELLRYSTVIVCLDPDAARKGLFFARSMPNATSRMIPRDLKYCSKEEIYEVLQDAT